jgi:hypothetical protein
LFEFYLQEEIMAIESEDSDNDDEDMTEYERQLSKFRVQRMDDEMGSDLEGKGEDDGKKIHNIFMDFFHGSVQNKLKKYFQAFYCHVGNLQ